MTALERLAEAILDNRVSIYFERDEYDRERITGARIFVDEPATQPAGD